MALVSVNPLDEVKATDINQFKDALEGAVAGTVPFFLRTATGEDFIIRLGGNASTRKLSVQDSDAAEVFKVDADGNLTAAGSFSPGTLILPSSTTPTPTAEGDIQWDSNDNHLVIGDGSGQVNIGPVASVLTTTGDILYASSAATLARLAASTDGYVLTSTGAGSAPAWEAITGVPTLVLKTSDQAVDNSSTLVNDSQLLFALEANSYYLVEVGIYLTSFHTGSMKHQPTVPSGTTWGFGVFPYVSGYQDAYDSWGTGGDYPTPRIIKSTGNNKHGQYTAKGWVKSSSTTGNFQWQFAQNVATSSEPATMRDGAYIRWEKVA